MKKLFVLFVCTVTVIFSSVTFSAEPEKADNIKSEEDNLRVWVRGRSFEPIERCAHVHVTDSQGNVVAVGMTRTGVIDFTVKPGVYRVHSGSYAKNVNSDATIVFVCNVHRQTIHLYSNKYEKEDDQDDDVCPKRILRPFVLHALKDGKTTRKERWITIDVLLKAANIGKKQRGALAKKVQKEHDGINVNDLDERDRNDAKEYKQALAELAELLKMETPPEN